MASHEPSYTIYIGASLPDRSGGGWAAIVVAGTACWEVSGHEAETSVDRLGLRAILAGVAVLPAPGPVRIITANQRLHEALTERLAEWQRNGWCTRSGRVVRHDDLWRKVHQLMETRTISSSLDPAVAGHFHAARAKRLAARAAYPARAAGGMLRGVAGSPA